MRIGVIATFMAIATPASADPAARLEATGFFGVDYFGDEIGLGGSFQPEQRPQTSPTFGGRLTYVVLRSSGDIRVDLGLEAELLFTPSWTGYGFEATPRPSYFAPVFGYRGNLLLRIGGGWMQPHIIGGIGAATVASSSPFMEKETDPVVLWGLGATFPMGDRWQMRFDGRQGLMEARTDGETTSIFELQVALGARFGLATKPVPKQTIEVVDKTPPPEPDRDTDKDGLPDKLDACPREAELVNGIDDEDGCPEPDPDNDNLVGAADKCPDQAEDLDKFEDDDGCPDPDNDKDGVTDAKDACPNEAETKNGIADEDGCADQVSPAVATALLAAAKVKFEANRVRLSKASKAALDQALVAMLNNPRMKISITAHPDKAGDRHVELAKKRADVVKWYLIEQGVAAGNLVTIVGPVAAKKAPLIVLSVAPV